MIILIYIKRIYIIENINSFFIRENAFLLYRYLFQKCCEIF